MRVIAGEFKGRKLTAPKGRSVRPTIDRVKEAIFSMIEPELPGATCLDLFAGTGALGIEALSRGASRAYFCEPAPASLAALRQNLAACRVEDGRAVILADDWRGALKRLGRIGAGEKCHIVLIDAPYEMCEHYSQILKTLGEYHTLEAEALIVIERDAGAGGYETPVGFERVREKKYGSIGVDLFVYAGIGGKDDM